jgi:para-aminobenzoate synthetase/4-amino-4-deoxychorismate lyase
MVTATFGVGDQFNQPAFDSPSQTFCATRLEEVIPLLETAEAEARAGSYVIVLLSYEAAPAFDSVLKTHDLKSFPLAWATVFRDSIPRVDEPPRNYRVDGWTPQIEQAEYNSAIALIHELISAGDTYQVNYTFPMNSTFEGDSFSWYRDLCRVQGTQYSAFLNLGRYQVLSLSPELFFARTGHQVVTRPMKGTVKRGHTAAEDEELATWLRNSAKDRAENVMIVDLLRNDLGKVSSTGSVQVLDLFNLERFETVWQMTSTVKSTLREGVGLADLMGALFPCGSITGAPKIRTMQIIKQLERFPRGVYTGTIGLLRPGGDCTFNVAIRTVVVDSQTGTATYNVGGGITWDSTAEREYEECLVKSRFLFERK